MSVLQFCAMLIASSLIIFIIRIILNLDDECFVYLSKCVVVSLAIIPIHREFIHPTCTYRSMIYRYTLRILLTRVGLRVRVLRSFSHVAEYCKTFTIILIVFCALYLSTTSRRNNNGVSATLQFRVIKSEMTRVPV